MRFLILLLFAFLLLGLPLKAQDWLVTDYPYAWSLSDESWLYLHADDGALWVYHYNEARWILWKDPSLSRLPASPAGTYWYLYLEESEIDVIAGFVDAERVLSFDSLGDVYDSRYTYERLSPDTARLTVTASYGTEVYRVEMTNRTLGTFTLEADYADGSSLSDSGKVRLVDLK
jgi:hypothetical protein